MNRILFCSQVPLDARLGMGKHWLELAEALGNLGWDAHAVGPDEIAGSRSFKPINDFSTLLREYLRSEADRYDVVEYDHAYLPFPRTEFASRPLLVARCMLLHHYLLAAPLPAIPGWWPEVRHVLNSARRRNRLKRMVASTDATVRNADLTIVSNHRDAALLVQSGANPSRIEVLPLGLTAHRFRQFEAVALGVPDSPVVGFVGTFDPRKGMREFPELVDRVSRAVPGVRFRLLGTAGLVPDAEGVFRRFPRRLRPLLEVRPRFDPEALPGLLSEVSVGVFPSRLESFGYGVLEMLAAAVPVIAYDAPGPDMILAPPNLVSIGAVSELAERVIALLTDRDRLRVARLQARARAADFRWEEIAARTAEAYARALARPGRTNSTA